MRERLFFIVLSLVLSCFAMAQHGLTTVGFTGDSITASTFNQFGTFDHARPNSVNQTKGDPSWSHQAVMGSGGNLSYFRNWAQHGARSQAIVNNIVNVAFVQQELPDVLVVHMGANDIATGQSSSVDDIKTHYVRLLEACQEKGVELIPCTVIPNASFDKDVKKNRALANAWIRNFARTNGLKLIDLFVSMVSPDGRINPQYSGDGVHPNVFGHMAMGNVAAECLKAYAGTSQPFLTQSVGDGDPLNLLYRKISGGERGASGEWQGVQFGELEGGSLPTPWLRYSSEPHDGAKTLLTSPRFSVSAGHTVEAGLRFRTRGFRDDGFGLYLKVEFLNSSGARLQEAWVLFAGRFEDNLRDETGYVLRRRFVVPHGASLARVQLHASRMPNPYILDITQMTLYDLTEMEIAPSY